MQIGITQGTRGSFKSLESCAITVLERSLVTSDSSYLCQNSRKVHPILIVEFEIEGALLDSSFSRDHVAFLSIFETDYGYKV